MSVVFYSIWLSVAALLWIVAIIVWRKDFYQELFQPKFTCVDDVTRYVGNALVLGPGLPLVCLAWPMLFPMGGIFGACLFWDRKLKPALNNKFFPQESATLPEENPVNGGSVIIHTGAGGAAASATGTPTSGEGGEGR